MIMGQQQQLAADTVGYAMSLRFEVCEFIRSAISIHGVVAASMCELIMSAAPKHDVGAS